MYKLVLYTDGYYVNYGTDFMVTDKIKITRPIINKRIVNWESLECLLELVINRLCISKPELYDLIFIYGTTDEKIKKKLHELFLKKKRFKSYYCIDTVSLVIFEKNICSGMIIDVCYDITKITCVYEGYIIESSTKYSCLTGKVIKKKKDKESYIEQFLNDIDICKLNLPIDTKREVLNNIILTGFNSKFIISLLQSKFNIEVDDKTNCVQWHGAKRLAEMRSFNEWIKNK